MSAPNDQPAPFECPSPGPDPCRFGMLEEDCETLRDRLVWLVRVRWRVVALSIAAVAVGMSVFPDAAFWPGLVLTVVALGAFNALWGLRLRDTAAMACDRALNFSFKQILADFVLLIFAIHCTGGASGPLAPLFVLHGVFSAILLPRRYTVRTIGLAVAFMLVSVLLQHSLGWIPVWRFGDTAYAYRWMIFAVRLGFILIAMIGATMIGLDFSRQLRRRHRRIADLAVELEKRNEELRRVDEHRVNFLGVASHDLKSPLGAIELKLDMFLGGYLGEITPPQREQIGSMKARIGALRAFIDDMLDVTTVDLKAIAGLPRKEVDLAGQLKGVLAEFGPSAEKAGLPMNVDIPATPVIVLGFPNRLEMVWANLVSNAIKYGGGGASIDVACRTDGDRAFVTVRDRGIGISEEDQKSIFTDFFRAKTVRSSGIPGTGLGLSIVKRVVDALGGAITLASKPAEGTTFTVTLPLAKEKPS